MTNEDNETLHNVIENYELESNHNWFPKTIKVLQRGPPNNL